ncbi:MAG: TonB family protein [Rudanella sp.]|nr:TonB family protein [Rudanella sp.]
MTTFDYLLRANLYLILFFGCYYLFLRRHTFFMLNRVYLLASVGLALGLPFVELPSETVVVLPMVAPQLLMSVVISPENLAPTGPDWVGIGWWIYGLVALALLIRLACRTTRLLNFIGKNPQQPLLHYTLVQPADPETPTFSFFRYMVLSPADAQAEPVRAHELVHIRQWHSADILAFEVIQALLWFNPVVLAYRAAIRQVHEFLADQAASARHRSDYANYLVSYALGDQPDLLSNSFFKPSLLTARLRMLHQRATSHWALGKYALVVPVVALVLVLTAARPQMERLVEPLLSGKPVPVKGRVTTEDNKSLPGATIVIRNGNAGTTTDANGRFMINVEPGAELVVSFVGFESRQITAKSGQEMQVRLKIKQKALNELVVVGYESVSSSSKPAQINGDTTDKEVFAVVEQQPEFPGGMSALGQYLVRNVRYPAAAQKARTQGRVFIEFMVSPTGAINNIRIQKGVGNGCDEEAVRVIAQMPRWEPGKQNGQPVAVSYILPIEFRLEPNDDKTGFNKEIFDNGSFPAPTDDPNMVVPAVNHTLEPKPGVRSLPTMIQVKATGRFLGDNPLYILDGVKMGSEYNLNTLDPKDIQSIDVLKGGSTKATYGEAGANGVIIITTKTGKQHELFKPAEPIKH